MFPRVTTQAHMHHSNVKFESPAMGFNCFHVTKKPSPSSGHQKHKSLLQARAADKDGDLAGAGCGKGVPSGRDNHYLGVQH